MTSYGIYSSHDYAGTDQGVDFSGAGQVPALDKATVTDVGRTTIIETGSTEWWYVIYRLDAGPYRNNYVYVAENFHPSVHKGQRLNAGQSIGYAPGAYPFTETGFNKTAQGWNAVAPLGGPTQAGAAMKAYIFGLIGSAPPVTVPAGAGGAGSIPVIGPVIQGAESTASFLGKLTDPHFWLRALEVVGGSLFILMGLYLLTRQVGLAQAPAAGVLPGPAKQAADDAARQNISDTFSEPAGIDAYQPAYRRSTEGVKRDKVSHDVSELGERRAARQKRLAAAKQADFGDVPY